MTFSLPIAWRGPWTVLICFALLGCEARQTSAPEHSDSERAPAQAEATAMTPPKNQVVARVNGQAIHAAEVEFRLARIDELYRLSNRTFDRDLRAEKSRQVIDGLIDRELLRHHADSQRVRVDEAQLEQALAHRIARDFRSRPAFERYLKEHRLEFDEFRRRVHDDLAIKKLLTRTVDTQPIPESQLRQHYERIALRHDEPSRVGDFEDVRHLLQQRARRSQMRQARQQLLERLRRNAEIEILAPQVPPLQRAESPQ